MMWEGSAPSGIDIPASNVMAESWLQLWGSINKLLCCKINGLRGLLHLTWPLKQPLYSALGDSFACFWVIFAECSFLLVS